MKIVLAYSGGLDTSIILRWLKENYQAEIVAFCADIGQEEELEGLEAKALSTGASKCIIEDLREEFARDFIFPMFQAGAIYEGQYFLGTSIARPLIAKRMVEIGRREKADAIAHGATGKGNDQVRFELTAAALAPELQVIAPWREERFRNQFPGRAEMIAFAKANKIPVEASAEKPYSMDRNLLHISYESGVLEDPWFDASSREMRNMYKLSVAPEDAPNEPEYVEVEFHRGNCIAVNGKSSSPLEVVQTLNKLGGKHGIGRVDIVVNGAAGNFLCTAEELSPNGFGTVVDIAMTTDDGHSGVWMSSHHGAPGDLTERPRLASVMERIALRLVWCLRRRLYLGMELVMMKGTVMHPSIIRVTCQRAKTVMLRDGPPRPKVVLAVWVCWGCRGVF